MKTITKTVKGKIEVIERHRTQRGIIFRPKQELEYYNIIEKSESCGCNDVKTFTKFYEVIGGLIPTCKAKLI